MLRFDDWGGGDAGAEVDADGGDPSWLIADLVEAGEDEDGSGARLELVAVGSIISSSSSG